MLKFIRIFSAVLLLACMIFIFCMSAQDSSESSDTSGRVITAVLKIVYPDFNGLADTEKEALVESLQFIVRKCAHFTIYAVMGILAFFTVGTYSMKFGIKPVLSAVICLLYSISDEIHQRFIPGRSGEFRDVCLDFSGSILAIIFMVLIVKFSKRKFFNNYFKG